uniref:Clone ZZZ249 mRNA sequence n=1 Tax=Schistosoma japonicum TaxID=6182 RepID=Q86E41_SCHJA|nr:hypothetical protein [Schistosoma japonicum]
MVMKNISDSKNQLTANQENLNEYATCLKEKTEAKYKGQFYTYIDYLLNEIQRDYPKYFREEFHTIVRSYNILEEYYEVVESKVQNTTCSVPENINEEDLIKLKYLMWDEAINGFYKKYYHLENDYYLKLKENLENSANNPSEEWQ